MASPKIPWYAGGGGGGGVLADSAHLAVQYSIGPCLKVWYKFKALVYDILPWTTAVFSYAIGPRKLSANEKFFVGAETVVSLLQTTQILSNVWVTADHDVHASSNKTKIVWIERELSYFTRGGCVSCLRACLGARLLPQSYQSPYLFFWGGGGGGWGEALTASVDSCAEIKSVVAARLSLRHV